MTVSASSTLRRSMNTQPELLLLGQELAVALDLPQGGRRALDHEVRCTEGETLGLGEQRAVPEPPPLGDVHDVERLLTRLQPVEQRPGRRRDPRQRHLVGRSMGNDGLEGNPETGVERTGLLHEPHIRSIAVDEGDDHVMALLREEPRRVVVSGTDAPVLDRAEYIRGGDAYSFLRAGPVVAQVRVQGRISTRRAIGRKT